MQEYVIFKGCVLYQDDIALLDDGNWFNDTLIQFAFLHTGMDYDERFALFIDPASISYLNLQCSTSAERLQFGIDLGLSRTKYLFVPVNNNTSFTASSSHWSLLLIETATLKSIHFDSLHQSNYNAARSTARSVLEALGAPQSQAMDVIKAIAPSQNNSYDCGVYAILFAQALALRLSEHQPLSASIDALKKSLETHLAVAIDSSSATQYRLHLKSLVDAIEKKTV